QKSAMTYNEYVEDCQNNNIYYYSYKDYQSRVNGQFRLCFKNGKVDPKIKKMNSVKIRITYENGQTVDKTIKVTVK
ncbi:MAG: hypothetical protein PHY47_17395, partial [Lachnospiraceae bacterium]|nr:hypothetical protein [Lachnospiraceae bacterium]